MLWWLYHHWSYHGLIVLPWRLFGTEFTSILRFCWPASESLLYNFASFRSGLTQVLEWQSSLEVVWHKIWSGKAHIAMLWGAWSHVYLSLVWIPKPWGILLNTNETYVAHIPWALGHFLWALGPTLRSRMTCSLSRSRGRWLCELAVRSFVGARRRGAYERQCRPVKHWWYQADLLKLNVNWLVILAQVLPGFSVVEPCLVVLAGLNVLEYVKHQQLSTFICSIPFPFGARPEWIGGVSDRLLGY